jgi:5-formyltetrahydrofolate cyclo-ligase
MSKTALRKELKNRVAGMTLENQEEASKAIRNQLASIGSVRNAESIFVYLPIAGEVDLLPLIALWLDESRTIYAPLINWEQRTMRGGLLTSLDASRLTETQHGIKEPTEKHPLPSDSIDVILVPGIGYDKAGGRLGRGGGYYDRFLKKMRPPIVLGVCFGEQIVDAIPMESHDQRMTAVVTPTNVLIE